MCPYTLELPHHREKIERIWYLCLGVASVCLLLLSILWFDNHRFRWWICGGQWSSGDCAALCASLLLQLFRSVIVVAYCSFIWIVFTILLYYLPGHWLLTTTRALSAPSDANFRLTATSLTLCLLIGLRTLSKQSSIHRLGRRLGWKLSRDSECSSIELNQ